VCVAEAEGEEFVVKVGRGFDCVFGFLLWKRIADGEVAGYRDADEGLWRLGKVPGLAGAALQTEPDGAFAAALAPRVCAAAHQALGVSVALQAAAEVVGPFTSLETKDVFAFPGVVLSFRIVIIVTAI
jgi:hypothetical protein